MTFRPEHLGTDLPALPPARDIETTAVSKACVEAHADLSEPRTSGYRAASDREHSWVRFERV